MLSRDEHAPDGLVVAQTVEELFVRQGFLWHLHAGGQVIRTTAEHPFFVVGQGDRLLTEDGVSVAVGGCS